MDMEAYLGLGLPNTISILYEPLCADPFTRPTAPGVAIAVPGGRDAVVSMGRRDGPPRARLDRGSPQGPFVVLGGSIGAPGDRGAVMKQVKKSVLLWYSPHEMYALVTGLSDYPKFLPWCERAEVLEVREGGVTARLHLSYLGLRQAFTTRNVHVVDQSVVLELVDGPFSVLDGTWRFVPVPSHAGADAKACRIEFDLRYSFANGALDALISPVFDRIANTFVDSFVKRAEQVHGPR